MSDINPTQAETPTVALPATGFSRAPAVRQFCGVAESTLWLWVRQRKIPAPVKFSPRVVAWRNEELHAWAADPLTWQAKHMGV